MHNLKKNSQQYYLVAKRKTVPYSINKNSLIHKAH